jgi:hypothetical protein
MDYVAVHNTIRLKSPSPSKEEGEKKAIAITLAPARVRRYLSNHTFARSWLM